MDATTSIFTGIGSDGPSRRDVCSGLAALAMGAVLPPGRLRAQNAPRPRVINVHHHLTAPAYVKFLTDNKVREFPIKLAAESVEDMDKAGVTIALCSTIGPDIWFGNLADTRRLAREINDYAAQILADYPRRFGMFTMLPLPDISTGSVKIRRSPHYNSASCDAWHAYR